jgi:glucose/arabinose dehydrogenase
MAWLARRRFFSKVFQALKGDGRLRDQIGKGEVNMGRRTAHRVFRLVTLYQATSHPTVACLLRRLPKAGLLSTLLCWGMAWGAPACDADNGGLTLPAGLCALVVADQLGSVRHLVVRDNGDIYLMLLQGRHGVMGLRDENGDGRMDRRVAFGSPGTGIALEGKTLYTATDRAVLRWKLGEGLEPEGPAHTVVGRLPAQVVHSAKSIAVGGRYLYVNIGAPSNSCQKVDRAAGSRGQDPCPLLADHAGIWRFAKNGEDQRQQDGLHYATGIRNAVAIDWNTREQKLYVVQHGRDQLAQSWPQFYSEQQGADLPAEEMLAVHQGDDYGWPYCYFDPFQDKRILAPEYGGDGTMVGRCDAYRRPVLSFPAHWAPNDLLFYRGEVLGVDYANGAFVAFHGSWNRAPLHQGGYVVAFVPFGDEGPVGTWQVFASGFAGAEPLAQPGDAAHRPMGLAQGPDGALYISDSVKGTIWRVIRSP